MRLRFILFTFTVAFLLTACFWSNALKQGTETPSVGIEFTSTPDELTRLSSLYPCIAGKTQLEHAYVLKVFDGDSILVEMGGRQVEVRYVGIDAPEFDGATWSAAGRSADVNRSLVLYRQVTMIRDISEIDRYDRLLRYVFVGDVFVNHELVRTGAAEAKAYIPDIACQGLLFQAMP